jgi:hypothetical protein
LRGLEGLFGPVGSLPALPALPSAALTPEQLETSVAFSVYDDGKTAGGCGVFVYAWDL